MGARAGLRIHLAPDSEQEKKQVPFPADADSIGEHRAAGARCSSQARERAGPGCTLTTQAEGRWETGRWWPGSRTWPPPLLVNVPGDPAGPAPALPQAFRLNSSRQPRGGSEASRSLLFLNSDRPQAKETHFEAARPCSPTAAVLPRQVSVHCGASSPQRGTYARADSPQLPAGAKAAKASGLPVSREHTERWLGHRPQGWVTVGVTAAGRWALVSSCGRRVGLHTGVLESEARPTTRSGPEGRGSHVCDRGEHITSCSLASRLTVSHWAVPLCLQEQKVKPRCQTWWELWRGISSFPPGASGRDAPMCGWGRDLWGLERPQCSCPIVPPGHRGLGGQGEAAQIRAWKCSGLSTRLPASPKPITERQGCCHDEQFTQSPHCGCRGDPRVSGR